MTRDFCVVITVILIIPFSCIGIRSCQKCEAAGGAYVRTAFGAECVAKK